MQPIELKILGTAAARPYADAFTSSALLQCAGNQILLDCGEGIQVQLPGSAFANKGLDAVCITHMHGDHLYGLPGLLTSMSLAGRTRALHLLGPAGLEKYLKAVFEYSYAWLSFPLKFIISPAEPSSQPLLEMREFEIWSLPLRHRVPAYGYVIMSRMLGRRLRPGVVEAFDIPFSSIPALRAGEDLVLPKGEKIPNEQLTLDAHPRKSIAYLTDTEPLAHWPTALAGPDILLHDATFSHVDQALARKTAHSTVVEAAAFAKTVGAKELLLTHRSVRYGFPDELLAEARTYFEATRWAQQGACYIV